LHAAIRANILQDIHKQYILWQSLKALKYMHSAELLHRDMKPSNLLLNSDCLMKVADFGLARSLLKPFDDLEANPVLTDYVATRWYRAPEILLGSTRYGKAVDMWSLGCIFGEMLGGKPVFQGSSTLNQLEKICEAVGRPSADEIEAMRSPFARTMLDSLQVPNNPPKKWSELYRRESDDAVDLMDKLMQWDPVKRLPAREGMVHPYCRQFVDTDPFSQDPLNRTAAAPVTTPFDDNDKKSTQVYRDKLYDEIQKQTQKGKEKEPKRGFFGSNR